MAKKTGVLDKTPLTVAEIEKLLLLSKGALSKLPGGFTLPRYTSCGPRDGHSEKCDKHNITDPDNYFSNPEYVPTVDETYVMSAKAALAALLGIRLGTPVQCYGVSGSGKTSFWEQFCARLGRELRVFQCLKGMTEKDLLGKQDFEIDEQGTRSGFSLGPLPQYIKHPGAVVLIDEQDVLDDAVGFVLQPLLTRNGVLRISTLGDGGNIYPAQDVTIAATSNTISGIDETGLYVRTMQDFSQVDRFLIKIPFEAPDERKILSGKYPTLSEDTVNTLVEFAEKYRNTPELQGNPLTTRRMVFIGELVSSLGSTDTALEIALFNGLPPLAEATARNLATNMNLAQFKAA